MSDADHDAAVRKLQEQAAELLAQEEDADEAAIDADVQARIDAFPAERDAETKAIEAQGGLTAKGFAIDFVNMLRAQRNGHAQH